VPDNKYKITRLSWRSLPPRHSGHY